MLSNVMEDSAVESESVPMWAPDVPRETEPDWRTVDRALRAIRRSRAALDAEEMHWLREAEVLQIWWPLGMVSALDYLERALGYAPRTAQDRLRVARALGTLPRLTSALTADELAFSAVRELTRVATPATEAAWIAAAIGKNLRQIEEIVADHHPGDRPDDPPDPKARTHVVRFELAAETFALLRQTRTLLDDEHGSNLADDAFVAALCNSVLDGAPTAEPSGRAKFQIALTVCQRCRRAWQEGAGAQVAIDPETIDRAMCDAQHIGSIDGPAPERAYQDIPPAAARLVWRRDGGRCRVPGCRSARGLELHHIVHRADGGSHDAMNLVTLCGACHRAHHRGALTISGTAEQLEVRRHGASVQSAQERVPEGPRGTEAAARTNATDMITWVNTGMETRTTAESASRETGVHVGASTTIPGVGADARGDVVNRTKSVARIDARAGAAAPMGTVESVLRETGAHADAVSATASTNASGICSASRLSEAILCTQAKAALTGLGWKPAIAHAAVAAAAAQGSDVSLERLIFEALRRCPVPKA
ncbi:MAG: HNH endonuclease [Deltaproteobacteria bacterium]|nr:MAG: HNH endonuclease [Deltaproteobacteria bacterium]